ncbi:MAG: ribbon-helix-helix domain-containing protein [Promethearchaeota archaeon]
MTTIPIRIDEIDLKKIDFLIKIGRFKNRSQALRQFIHDRLKKEILLFEQDDKSNEKLRLEVLSKLKKKDNFSFSLLSKKNAEEIIGENRERY